MLLLRATLLCILIAAHCLPAAAQSNVHVGFHGAYSVTWPHFLQRDLVSSVKLHPGQSFAGGVDISFFISEQASIGTGFRLRSQVLRASADGTLWSSDPVSSRSRFPMIEIPLRFSIRQPIGPRFSIRQDFALEAMISGSPAVDSATVSQFSTFTAAASPSRSFNFALMAGAGIEYRTSAGIRFDLIAEYHQGVGNTTEVGTVEYRSPDQTIILPVVHDMSYFAVRMGMSVPADKFSELFRFLF